MVARYKAALAPKPEPAPKAKRASERIVYVALPRAILAKPPIRHRGQGPEAGLSVFEFALAAACAALASNQLATARHNAAMQFGKSAIVAQRRTASKDMAEFQLGGVSYEFLLAGKGGYLDGQAAFDCGNVGFELTVETTKSGWLRAAGLSRKGGNLRKIFPAIRRLGKSVGAFPPVLLTARELPSGKLRLSVNGKWLPRTRYGRVALPVPTIGPTVLALYLLLAALDFRPGKRTTIDTTSLYRRLRIPLTWRAHTERSLDRALAAVNAHLRKLNNNKALTKANLTDAFEIEPIGKGSRVRFKVKDKEAELKHEEQTRVRRKLNLQPDDRLEDDQIEREQLREARQKVEQRRDVERQELLAIKARLNAAR